MPSPEQIYELYAPVDRTGGDVSGSTGAENPQSNSLLDPPLFELQPAPLDASEPMTDSGLPDVDHGSETGDLPPSAGGSEQRTWEENFMKGFVRKLRASPRYGFFAVSEEAIPQKVQAVKRVFEKIDAVRESKGEPIGLHYLELYFRMSYPEFDEERINKELDFIRRNTEWMRTLANPEVEKDFMQLGWRDPDNHI